MAAVQPPAVSLLKELNQEPLPKYEFQTDNLFTAYSISSEEFLFRDANDQWYAGGYFKKDSFHGLKYGRQIFCPPYKEIPESELSFLRLLEKNGLTPLNAQYDKGFCHTIVNVDSLDSIPLHMQSRLAHADGDDDPQVAHSLHYIQSLLDGKRTRFLSGWESHSFATITESTSFCEQLLLPVSSWLYLLYYTHFIMNNGEIPSYQMMPRLLGNLWASTTHQFPYNEKLIQILPLQ
jgi:hypothetical protein